VIREDVLRAEVVGRKRDAASGGRPVGDKRAAGAAVAGATAGAVVGVVWGLGLFLGSRGAAKA